MQSREICAHITARVIEAMERGAGKWVSPYGESVASLPSNPVTGSPYHGINTLALWAERELRGYASSRWITYKQASEVGAHVRSGEHATFVVFFKPLQVADQAPNAQPGDTVSIPMLRAYPVFNLSQIDGAEQLRETGETVHYPFTPIEAGERMLANCGIHWIESERYPYPCYVPALDFVSLIPRTRYAESASFYSTAAHEFTHATGHKSRLDRVPYKTQTRRGAYAFEECVAELGSVFLTANLGLPAPIDNHAAYIADWLEVLRSDNRAIFKAAAQAQRACDWLLERIKREPETLTEKLAAIGAHSKL